jgi:hypothetical protein
VVGFTIDSRGKVPGKTCEKRIIIIIMEPTNYAGYKNVRSDSHTT